MSLWELPPSEAAYPYHYHLAEEELLVVLDGRPSMRTPDGWRDLLEGEVVPFLRGEQGAHQLLNRTEETVRFLAFSTNGEPDIVLYPDSGKLGAFERLPPGEACGQCSASTTPSITTTASNHRAEPRTATETAPDTLDQIRKTVRAWDNRALCAPLPHHERSPRRREGGWPSAL